jgi:DNA-binding transcriptional MerR regulator
VLNPRPEIPDKALSSFADTEDERDHLDKTLAASRSLLDEVNKVRQANAKDAPGVDLGKPLDAVVRDVFASGRPDASALATSLRQSTALGDREAQSVAKAVLAYYDAASQNSAASRAYNQIMNGNGKPGAAAGPGERVTMGVKNLRAEMTGALAKAGAKVRDVDYKAAVSTLRYKLQDNLVDLDNIQRAIAKEHGLSHLPDSTNAYQEAELSKLRRAEQQKSLQEVELPAFIKEMQDHHVTVDEVHEYMQARHAPERNSYIASINDKIPDGGSGITNLDAAATMARFAVEQKTADLGTIASKLDAIMARSLKMRLDAGLIDQETFDKLSTFYKHYVPLKGRPGNIDEDDRDPSMNVGRGFALAGPEYHAALGRYDEAGNIPAQIFSDASETIARSEKAKVGRTLLELMRAHPDCGWKTAKPQFMRTLDSEGKVRDVIDPSWMREESVVPVKENGKTIFLEFENKRLAMALKGAGPETSNIVMRAIRAWTNIQTGINTRFNPEFIVSNLLRHWQEVGFNLSAEQTAKIRNAVLKDVVTGNSMRGVWSALHGDFSNPWARDFQRMQKAGGRMLFTGPMDTAGFEKKMQELTKDPTTLAARSKEVFSTLFHGIEQLNATAENAVRLSAFHHALAAGMSEKQAAHLAADISINYTRKGEWGNVMNTLYMFSNASIQTSARMMLAVGRSPSVRRLMYGVIATGFGLDMMNRLLGDKDKDGVPFYDKLPDHIKNRNIVVMLPGTGGRYIQVPAPYGYSVPYTAGRALASALPKEVGGAGDSVWKAASETILDALENFNPVGGSGNLATAFIPSFARPVAELALNKDFASRPIVPEPGHFERFDKPPSERFYPSTTEPSRAVAEWLNAHTGGDKWKAGAISVSPALLDYATNQILGGAGAFASRSLSALDKGLTGKENLEDMASHGEIPFLRRVFGETPENATSERFRDMESGALQAEARLKGLIGSGDRDAAKAALKEDHDFLTVLPLVKAADKELTHWRTVEAAIEKSTLPDAEKNQRSLQVQQKMQDVKKSALKGYYTVQSRNS